MLVCFQAERPPGCWVLLAWLAEEVGGCFVLLFVSLCPGLSVGKYQPGCDGPWRGCSTNLGRMDGWGKADTTLLSHRSFRYRRTRTAAGCYKCAGDRSLELVFTVYQGVHALTKVSFPVWAASRKFFPGWNIHRFSLLPRPSCVIRVALPCLVDSYYISVKSQSSTGPESIREPGTAFVECCGGL